MDEATLERHLHLTMTLIGGFMGGYAILNRHDVFGSAQLGKANPNTDVIQKQFLPSFRLIPHPAQALRQCGVVFASCAF